MKTQKSWYTSKTKISALLIGLGPVLIVVGGMLNGSINLSAGITQLASSVGIILGVFGIRDLPFINK